MPQEFTLQPSPVMRTSRSVSDIVVTDSFTPTITFGIPGDLSVTYNSNFGRYLRIGELVWAFFSIVTASFTHSTAAGALLIAGFPYTARYESTVTDALSFGNMGFNGITKANYTQFMPTMNPNSKNAFIRASASGQVISSVSNLDVPSGGTVTLKGAVYYIASNT